MILDLHLKETRLSKKLLVWFNGNTNHFIFQFSDDGAPETSELGMSIGSLTCWNFERDFHYLLHCLSVSEKDTIMEDIWKQHTNEMQVIEGNLMKVCGHQCTVEFQPSADQSWQNWANNELNQAATYPSPYANVHHGELSRMGGTIGHDDSSSWQPFTQENRQKCLAKLESFRKNLPKMSESQNHKKELEFMAANGIRQLGQPRIRIYANLQRPEPMHNEINGWQHLLNLLYKEALQRQCVNLFLTALSSPTCKVSEPASSEGPSIVQAGCGPVFVANKIREHYNNKSHQANKLTIRLIGKQAIAIARYSYRLVDIVQVVG